MASDVGDPDTLDGYRSRLITNIENLYRTSSRNHKYLEML